MFIGAKVALFIGPKLLVYLHDDRADIPFPAYWDLPGGGREGRESPEACVIRETEEEFALVLRAEDLIWTRENAVMVDPAQRSFFFAAHLGAEAEADIQFGDEGQYWRLVDPAWFLGERKVPEAMRGWVREYLAQRPL